MSDQPTYEHNGWTEEDDGLGSLCAVTTCVEHRFGTIPVTSPIASLADVPPGQDRIPVCPDHGRQHHAMYEQGWRDRGEQETQ